ncbi:MAG: UDP-N-acetylmuramate dehydrogenase [Clostridia bacterium]|nr:UDP-N-acetylmuramate dehydrogenase [Clostridia bacterium]
MPYQKLLDFAKQEGIVLLENEPLCNHTSFRIGGPARFFAMPVDTLQLSGLMAFVLINDVKYAVVGNGSNLLVPDEGFDGLVIRTPEGQPRWQEDGCTVTVPSGYSMTRLSAEAARRGLSGLTFAQGIPGTVGGAVVMNAGAYGGQIADTLLSSRCVTPEGIRTLTAQEHKLSYRHSVYADHPGWVCAEATFRLTPGDKAQIQAEMADYAQRRRDKQPLEWPSAGSTFKRPEGHFAGKLIEDAGLKGFTVGGAQVSEKHAGFVINKGGATCADVLSLMEQVSDIVYEKFGVRLEPEVKILK